MKTQSTILALIAITLIITNESRAQGSLMPSGAPAATMRSLDQIQPHTPISSLPFTISQPGTYYLTKNLAGTIAGIAISSSGVTIDLNGFELVGDRLVVGRGITVAAGCENVTIRNGTVRSWGGDGVHALAALYVAVDDLWVEDCVGDGIAMSSGSIGHITSQGNGGGGLFQSNPIPGIGIVVKKNPGSTSEARLLNNSGGGLVLQGICDIEFSGRIAGNTGHGIRWTSQLPNDILRMNLTDCDVSHNTSSGLHIEEATPVRVVCTTRRSSFLDNGGDGITLKLTHADAGLQLDLQEGAASDNGGYGMNVQEGAHSGNQNTAIDFQFSRNAFAGSAKIDCGVAPSLYSRVVARDNGGPGLSMEGGTWTLEDCLIADNVGAGVSMISRTLGGHKAVQTIKSCEFSRNTGAGFTITPDAGGGAYKVCIKDLSVSKNGASGVALNGTCELSAGDVHLSDNTGHGLAWFSLAVGGGLLGATPSVRMSLQRLRSTDNTLSGLYVSEGSKVEVDCSFEACTFDRNHDDGVTLLLTDPAARLGFMHRGGGACDNMTGCGLNIRAGLNSEQGFFDIALSRNGLSGCQEIDAGSSPGLFQNAVIQSNGTHGLDLVGGSWTLKESVVQDNGSDGIVVAAKKDFKGHVTLLKKNGSSERNGGDGIRVYPAEADAACRVVMQEARCSGNLNSGLHVVADLSGSFITLDWLDSTASNNGDSGIVLAGLDPLFKTDVRIQGGEVCNNVKNGIDLESSPRAQGKIHRLHMGSNGIHGLISSAASLAVTDNQANGNAGSGLHILAGAHIVARNVCTDNVIGVYLANMGSMVLQNTFGGSSGGGLPQVPVADLSGASDVAPMQNAASGTNPLGNLIY